MAAAISLITYTRQQNSIDKMAAADKVGIDVVGGLTR
jgi:hypothetical protein